ncbi:MAG TPA: cytochrome P450, partial [Solirubrobacterales bacterium]|nr:cytochrome P450 [Solirubrobacterales bacterium]
MPAGTAAKPAPHVDPPKQLSANPVVRVLDDVRAEAKVRFRGSYPPGPQEFSFARTHQAAHDPLPMLLAAYEEFGPIFSLRLLHSRVVFMLGPEANHFVTVAHPENFHWRESSFGDLIPLLGDGLLTIDDAYHDRAREIMMP